MSSSITFNEFTFIALAVCSFEANDFCYNNDPETAFNVAS